MTEPIQETQSDLLQTLKQQEEDIKVIQSAPPKLDLIKKKLQRSVERPSRGLK